MRSPPQTKTTEKDTSTCVHSAESGVAVRVEEAATAGYIVDLVSHMLNGTKCAEVARKAISLLQPGSKTSDVAATFTARATGRRGQHVFEIFAVDADEKCKNGNVEATRHQVDMMKNGYLPDRLENPDNNDFGHLETTTYRDTVSSAVKTFKMTVVDDVSSVFGLDFRGSTNRLRQHQHVRDVMVNVSRNVLRPVGVLTNLGWNDWNNWKDVPVHIKKDRENAPEPGTPTSTTNGETLSRSEGKRRSD